MKKLCVIGSINTDLIATVENFPKPGQTVTGSFFDTTFGGKGANQAVALGKLDADVTMVGKLGTDLFGDNYMKHFENIGVKTVIDRTDGSSGVAVIEIDKTAQNHIVVVPGANGTVDNSFVDSALEKVSDCDIFLLQLEIPLETVVYAAKKLSAMGKTVILDPAPAVELPDELLSCIDYITPNETEIEIVSKKSVSCDEDLKIAAQALIDRGVKTIIAKAGGNGAYIINRKEFVHVPPYKVNPVDTTAAGDSFNAGFAFGLALELPIFDCVKIGNAVGGLATEGMGAQSAMPDKKTVKEKMGEELFQ